MPSVLKTDELPVRSDEDIVAIRHATRAWASQLGFSLVDQTKVVTAASELARNAIVYGGGGSATLEVVSDGGRKGLRLVFVDQGPGIADLEAAMRPGFSTGTGLGLGLSGSKRLVNEFDITSRPGEGTKVTIVKWNR